MLPNANRLRASRDFAATVRRGRRASSPALVAHLSASPAAVPASAEAPLQGPQVGFVTSRAIGSAVSRNRVRRQLRHLMRERTDRLPAGSRLVIRVLPAAAGRRSEQLARELDEVLRRAVQKLASQ